MSRPFGVIQASLSRFAGPFERPPNSLDATGAPPASRIAFPAPSPFTALTKHHRHGRGLLAWR